MNWYKGNIAEAVAQSKAKNAIFVVYVEGKDQNSIKLSKFIDDSKVKRKLESQDFVAIKIESESQAYMQFASIYQMVPVPSIFFIGSTGTPLEIATGIVASPEELELKISKVLESCGKNPDSSSASSVTQTFINQEALSGQSSTAAAAHNTGKAETSETKDQKDDEIVCEGGVCSRKTIEPPETAGTPVLLEEKSNSGDQKEKKEDPEREETKLADSRKALEQKRRERIEEEKRLEVAPELQRRKEGKDLQNLRAWQKDQELKELKDSIKREKQEEQAARERILAQIAADRAERAQKFAAENKPSTSQAAAGTQTSTAPILAATDESRLQFRFANGDNRTNTFKCSTTLEEVRNYVKNDLLPGTGIKEFTLATTYPKKEFGSEHYTQTLIELELFPSAVILIIGKEATGPSAMIARQGGIFNIFSMVVMSILNPIFSILTTAKNWITGQTGNNTQSGAQKRANEEQGVRDDAAKRRNLDRFLSGNANNENDSSADKGNSAAAAAGSSQAYRRYVTGSNVHRLSDNRKDSDDENATWNGNSTQQQ